MTRPMRTLHTLSRLLIGLAIAAAIAIALTRPGGAQTTQGAQTGVAAAMIGSKLVALGPGARPTSVPVCTPSRRCCIHAPPWSGSRGSEPSTAWRTRRISASLLIGRSYSSCG
jgi:hypothetical protein